MIEHLFSADALIALLTLTFLEIVLGIDNVIFISIVTGKLPDDQRKRATRLGLFLAMFIRIGLLFCISWLVQLKEPWFSFDNWNRGQKASATRQQHAVNHRGHAWCQNQFFV